MFNFWPFNVARKRREAEREKRIAQLVEDMDRPQPKRNKVIPMSDPRHPRNLSPQQRADKLAQQRRTALIDTGYARNLATYRATDERRMEPAPAEAVAQVQQFRCDHPAISEFWQQQQERCDSPTDTSSPSCDAPSTD